MRAGRPRAELPLIPSGQRERQSRSVKLERRLQIADCELQIADLSLLDFFQPLLGLQRPGAFWREIGKPALMREGFVAAAKKVERSRQMEMGVGLGFVSLNRSGEGARRQF